MKFAAFAILVASMCVTVYAVDLTGSRARQGDGTYIDDTARVITAAWGNLVFWGATDVAALYATNDWGSTANGGLCTNAANVPTYASGVLYFDGTNDHVVLPAATSIGGLSACAASVWFKTSLTTRETMWCEASSSSATPFMLLDINGATAGQLRFFMRDDANVLASCVSPLTTYNDGAWHQVIGSRGLGTNSLYVDGVNVTNIAQTHGATTINLFTWGGVRQTGSGLGFPFQGRLDDLILMNRALTTNESVQLYEAQKSTYPVRP